MPWIRQNLGIVLHLWKPLIFIVNNLFLADQINIDHGSTYAVVVGISNYQDEIQIDSTYMYAYYNMASLNSLKNQSDLAFDYLEKALINGYKNYDWMQEDADLFSLREEKERW